MNTNNDDQNPEEKPNELSDSFFNAAIIILGAAVLTVSAPLTAVAAGALAVSAMVRKNEES
jgi:hypothetical protein